MTLAQSAEQQFDLRPFQISVPVPPILAEACGYRGQVFSHSLDARFVGFWWERSGDETNFDDGRSSGTGEYTGFQAYVEHPRIAVHLRHYDWGSSETLPRHMLVLDRTDHHLYGLPVRLAQKFLAQQWHGQQDLTSEPEGVLHVASLADLTAALDSRNWQEVQPPEDIDAQVMAVMRRQGQLVDDLVEWLDGQQKPLSPERMAEYEPHAPAMLLRHVVDNDAFAQAGELVHIHEVHDSGDLVTVTFYRDNGIDGPDASHLFAVNGSWSGIGETIETLLEPAFMDDLLESGASLEAVFGRYAAWNGQAFPIVPMLDTLAIRVSLPCARCGRNPLTVFARSGLHRGAFCYVYDALGNSIANLRDQEYVCRRCEKAHSEDGTSVAEDGQQDVR